MMMQRSAMVMWGALVLAGCGGSTPPASSADANPDSASPSDGPASSDAAASDTSAEEGNQFALKDSDTAGDARGESESKIKPTATEAAVRFFIVDRKKDDAPIPGIVISLTAPDGKKFYTEETDTKGYAEVLVPVGKEYELVYLSLGRRKISAKVDVEDLPSQNIKLTLRYKGWTPKSRPGAKGKPVQPGFVLKGVQFDTGKATIRPDSFDRLASVLEYMTHKKSARIQISGHTDNVGDPGKNKKLSERRAQAVKDYLVEKGVEADRLEAVGYGDEQPVASNDTSEGRQENRRIEAKEL